MRLLLDEQIPSKVALIVAKDGHDVVAVVEDKDLIGSSDLELAEYARRENRIIVTFNIADFVPLLAGMTAAGELHAGCVLISTSTVQPGQFAKIARGIVRVLKLESRQTAWMDRIVWLTKAWPIDPAVTSAARTVLRRSEW